MVKPGAHQERKLGKRFLVWSFTVPWGGPDAALGPREKHGRGRRACTLLWCPQKAGVSRIRVCIVSVGPWGSGPRRTEVSGHGVSVVGGWGCGLELLEKD